nr:transglutaminase-like cysteine peptidase [Aestuariivirga litoralis]
MRLVVVLGMWMGCAGLVQAGNPAAHPVRGNFDFPDRNAPAARIYGKALPPVGYVDFCGRGENECQFKSGKVEPLMLTSENWDAIFQINKHVNTKIRPATDVELYGSPDFWTYPVSAGDCEDYVLLKKRLLVGLGFNPELLLITVVLDENREGHAVLTIPTNHGDFILDNRRTEILRWDETGYIFLKRQSQPAANEWVSLQKAAPQVVVSTKAN